MSWQHFFMWSIAALAGVALMAAMLRYLDSPARDAQHAAEAALLDHHAGLLDHYAGLAMQSLIAEIRTEDAAKAWVIAAEKCGCEVHEAVTNRAFDFAEAMIAERKRRMGGAS